MIIFFIVSSLAGIGTVFPTAVASFPRMCVDHVLGWSIESLLLAERCSAAGVILICRTCMDDPWAGGVLHILPGAVIAVIKVIPRQLADKDVSFTNVSAEFCRSRT